MALILISSNCISAYAASYTVVDYEDYITNVTTDGDTDNVSVEFSYKNNIFWEWFQLTATDQYSIEYGGYVPYTGPRDEFKNYPVVKLDFTKPSLPTTQVVIRPLGFSCIDLSDIPNNTPISNESFLYFYDMPIGSDGTYGNYQVEFTLQYFDSNNHAISLQRFYYTKSDISSAYGWKEPYYFEGEMIIPDGAVMAMPRIAVTFYSFNDTPTMAEIVTSPLKMEFSISSLFRLQQSSKKTNKILNAIQSQNQTIIDQNQTIIDGTPEQNAAADKFESDANDAVSDMEQISDQMAAVTTPEVNVQDLVPTDVLLGTHFLSYVDALNNFWDCKEIVVILTILASLLLIGVVLHGKKGW